MPLFDIWQEANCLAARGGKKTFWTGAASSFTQDFSADVVPYIQGRLSWPYYYWGSRLLFRPFSNVAGVIPETEMPVSLPRPANWFPVWWYRSGWRDDPGGQVEMPGLNSYLVSGKTLLLADCPPYPTDRVYFYGSGVHSFSVREGRQWPTHRIDGELRYYADGFYWTYQAPLDVSIAAILDPVGSAFCVKTNYVSCLIAFVPKINGQVTVEGAYAANKPVFNRNSISRDGQRKLQYAEQFLPDDFRIFEIGLFSQQSFTPKKTLVVVGNVYVDAALSREILADETGTTFCCAVRSGSYMQSIDFPFVPASPDHVLAGALQRSQLPSDIKQYQAIDGASLFEAYPQSGAKGFNAGEFAAFQKAAIDHGKLKQIPFFSGATATPLPPPQPPGSSPVLYFSRAEWQEWEHSQFAWTMSKTGAYGIDGSVVSNDSLVNQKAIDTPVYGTSPVSVSDGVYGADDVFEMFPSRKVTAKAARVAALSNSRSQYDDNQATIGASRPDGKMVFNGKTINGVALSFVPYSRNLVLVQGETQTGHDVVTGMQPATLTPLQVDTTSVGVLPPGSYSTGFYDATFNNRYDVWWRHRQTVPRPVDWQNGPLAPGGVAELRNGERCQIFAYTKDQKTIERLAGNIEVTASKERDAHVYQASLTGEILRLHTPPDGTEIWKSPNFSVSGTPDQFIAAGSMRFWWSRFSCAPLTGDYSLSSFAIGNVPSAGNLFRYTGAGKWSAEQTITHKIYPIVLSIDDQWKRGALDTFSGKYFYDITYVRSGRYATIPITEQWKLSADCVELYCELGAALQEHGNYQPDPPSSTAQEKIAYVEQMFPRPDLARGRIVDTAIYVDGAEPSPVLTMRLRYRTALRAELKMSVDTSDLPEYPHSMANQPSANVANTVVGSGTSPNIAEGPWESYYGAGAHYGGGGNVSGQYQTNETQHSYRELSFTFNKQQTAQLMRGDEILVTEWQKAAPGTPVFADVGSVFQHAIKIRLDVSQA